MHRSLLVTRLSIVACFCLLALCLGAASARARALYPSCSGICENLCEEHDRCQTYYEDSGVCFFWCMDGYNDAVLMGR